MIKFVDLSRQYESIKDEINQALAPVLAEGDFILGKEVTEFERDFADFIGVDYCVGVASGFDALTLSLVALGVGSGDEVIAPANTFIATVLGAAHLQATIKLVDIGDDYNLDYEQLKRTITAYTKVIIPVHLYGHPCDMTQLTKIASDYDVKVLEDSAQAHGARWVGQRVGSFGDVAAFSFYPGKNLGAYGDGGAVTTNNEQLAQKIRCLRDVGQSEKYIHSEKGFNSRLDTLQAAVLRVKLKHLETWNKRRRELAALYLHELADTKAILPNSSDQAESVWHLFVIQVPRRDELMAALKSAGIVAGIHYPIPIHLQKAFTDLGYQRGSFPKTELVTEKIISLPLFPELREEEIRQISQIVKKHL